jgi:ABC-type multidrug transport system ATPase subunit
VTTIDDVRPTTTPEGEPGSGTRIEAHQVGSALRNGRRILSDVSVVVEPGQVVAVIGASGAGKTTLLEILAGLRRPTSGTVHLDGWDLHRHRDAFRTAVGYVPQDDIIHRDLPVDVTIRHAADLRLPDLAEADRARVVEGTIDGLGMTDHAATVVARLSGGQRKRVSIAVELLTRPRAFFLDEPTSGLDPGSARTLLATLRSLAAGGSTIVLTTHSPDDVERCDRVVVLGRGGRLAFHGTPADAAAHFGVDDVADIYRVLEAQPEPRRDGPTPRAPVASVAPVAPDAGPPGQAARSLFRHQLAVLCRRNTAVLVRNRLTLAIMVGAPLLVIAMFLVLFRPGTFDEQGGDPLAAVSITYWLAFSAFFFGLTYGLLQVCTEIAVVRRERHVGLGLGAYLLAKLVVLLPVLVVVNALMVVALRASGRLSDLRWQSVVALVGLLLLDAVAALSLGLLASAAVADPSHATLALPMLCFPAVLFGGAVLPVRAMAGAGRAISAGTIDRWAFEAIGGVLDLGTRFGPGAQGAIVAREHGDAFTGDLVTPVIVLVLCAAALLVTAERALARRTSVS